jgi:hypothetical protein
VAHAEAQRVQALALNATLALRQRAVLRIAAQREFQLLSVKPAKQEDEAPARLRALRQ